MRIFFASIIKSNFDLVPWVGYNVFAPFPMPHRGDLYKCAGPTVEQLQHIFFFKKTNARQMPGGGDACGLNWLSHNWCAYAVEWAKKKNGIWIRGSTCISYHITHLTKYPSRAFCFPFAYIKVALRDPHIGMDVDVFYARTSCHSALATTQNRNQITRISQALWNRTKNFFRHICPKFRIKSCLCKC